MSGTRRGGANVTAEMALEMLQSALGYWQRAGQAVTMGNEPAGLVITLPAARKVDAVDSSSVSLEMVEPAADA